MTSGLAGPRITVDRPHSSHPFADRNDGHQHQPGGTMRLRLRDRLRRRRVVARAIAAGRRPCVLQDAGRDPQGDAWVYCVTHDELVRAENAK